MRESRRDVLAEPVRGLVAVLGGKKGRGIRTGRGGGHRHPNSPQRLDERSPRERCGVLHLRDDHLGVLPAAIVPVTTRRPGVSSLTSIAVDPSDATVVAWLSTVYVAVIGRHLIESSGRRHRRA